MATRIFIGRIALGVREEDIEAAFSKFGKIEKIEIKNGNNSSFAFLHVDFDDPNMEKNLDEMNQVVMDGQRVVVEVAKGRERHDMGAGNKPKSNLRITISNIEGPVSWQDLKDWARVCGNVNFANVFNGADGEKVGVIEFEKVEEFESALSRLEDEPLKGQHVKVAKEIPGEHENLRAVGPSRPANNYRGGGGYPPRDSYGRPGYRGGGGGGPRGGYDMRGGYDRYDRGPPQGRDYYPRDRDYDRRGPGGRYDARDDYYDRRGGGGGGGGGAYSRGGDYGNGNGYDSYSRDYPPAGEGYGRRGADRGRSRSRDRGGPPAGYRSHDDYPPSGSYYPPAEREYADYNRREGADYEHR